jgi:hypothetical protein
MTITRMLLTSAGTFALLVALPTGGADFGPDHAFAKGNGGGGNGGNGGGGGNGNGGNGGGAGGGNGGGGAGGAGGGAGGGNGGGSSGSGGGSGGSGGGGAGGGGGGGGSSGSSGGGSGGSGGAGGGSGAAGGAAGSAGAGGAGSGGSQGDGGNDKGGSLAAFVASPIYGRVASTVPTTVTASPVVVSPLGVPCQTVTQTIDIGGQTVHASAVVCRQPDGTWRLNPAQSDELFLRPRPRNERPALTERAAPSGALWREP